MDTLTQLPESITAGTTVKYTVTFGDFPANAGWTLKLYLAGASILRGVSGTASGAAFAVTLSSAQTAPLIPGNYQWQEIATKSGEDYVARSGTLVVEANITTAIAGDLLSWDEKQIPALEAACEALIKNPTKAYSIGGRAFTKVDLPVLMRILESLRAKVAAQGASSTFGTPVRDRLSRPA